MKKINNEYNNTYSETIDLKVRSIYFLIVCFKIIIISPFISLVLKEIILKQINTFLNNSIYNIGLSILIATLISLVSTKPKCIKNPLFLEDKILISSNLKNNGDYEDVYSDKFKILLVCNIIGIVPLSFLMALTVSSIICLIFNFLPSLLWINGSMKYFLTLILLNILVKTFNEPFIKYLRYKN